MRQIGLAVIASMIQALPTVPLQATGYDLATGKPHDHVWLAPWLRNATEDMRVLVRAYRRERALGREHPEWLAWVKTYVDWLLQQQRPDGSFPRRWKPGSNEVEEPSGTTSYSPVPLLVLMTEETGDPKYAQAAARAAEFVWANWGTRGLFIGGASDNPNITDKEAGMLSLEAFLSLYDATERTPVAGARQGRRGLRRELDLDLEPADAARCRRRPTALEEGRADRSVSRASRLSAPAAPTSIWTGPCLPTRSCTTTRRTRTTSTWPACCCTTRSRCSRCPDASTT